MHGENLTEVQAAAIIHRLSENRNISFAFLLITTLLPSWGAWIYDAANQLYQLSQQLTGPLKGENEQTGGTGMQTRNERIQSLIMSWSNFRRIVAEHGHKKVITNMLSERRKYDCFS